MSGNPNARSPGGIVPGRWMGPGRYSNSESDNFRPRGPFRGRFPGRPGMSHRHFNEHPVEVRPLGLIPKYPNYEPYHPPPQPNFQYPPEFPPHHTPMYDHRDRGYDRPHAYHRCEDEHRYPYRRGRSRSLSRGRSRSRSRSYERRRDRSRSRSYSRDRRRRRSRSRSYSASRSYSRSRSRSRSRTRSRSRSRSSHSNSRRVSKSRSKSPIADECKKKTIEYWENMESAGDDSEVDLEEELHSLSYHVHCRKRLLKEAVRSLKGKRLKAMKPPILKNLVPEVLSEKCLKVLEDLEPDTIVDILEGKLVSKKSHKVKSTTAVGNDDAVENASKKEPKNPEASSKKSKKKPDAEKSKSKAKKKSKQKEEESNSKPKKKKLKAKKVKKKKKKETEPTTTPAGHKSLMELLELEFRAKAIKALLKTQGVTPGDIDAVVATDNSTLNQRTETAQSSQNELPSTNTEPKGTDSQGLDNKLPENSMRQLPSKTEPSPKTADRDRESASNEIKPSEPTEETPRVKSVAKTDVLSCDNTNSQDFLPKTAKPRNYRKQKSRTFDEVDDVLELHPEDSDEDESSVEDSQDENNEQVDLNAETSGDLSQQEKLGEKTMTTPDKITQPATTNEPSENEDESDESRSEDGEKEASTAGDAVTNQIDEVEEISEAEDGEILSGDDHDSPSDSPVKNDSSSISDDSAQELSPNVQEYSDEESPYKGRRSRRRGKFESHSSSEASPVKLISQPCANEGESLERMCRSVTPLSDEDRGKASSPVEFITSFESTRDSDNEDFTNHTNPKAKKMKIVISSMGSVPVQGCEPADPGDSSQSNEVISEPNNNNNNDSPPESSAAVEESKTDEPDSPKPITWYERWFNSKSTQDVVKTNKIQKNLRKKLKKCEREKKTQKQQEGSTTVDTSVDAGEPIIGSIEEYEQLFGKKVPTMEKSSFGGNSPNAAAVTATEQKSSESEVHENEQEDDLWGDIIGSDEDD